ncbi:hypothetical protein [Mycoplasma parvum]|uniref:Uncharacterized protein n=1 Tax=Mycoplasma parvum str. Indiana TaxID=1403316 RepID=U5NBM7_9MOLU|nr:hypothetical protein [Mycoplasma parvum]AGX88956.1 hypothetical protein PRV_00955 [Mycoplasma parvum str. Indiana]
MTFSPNEKHPLGSFDIKKGKGEKNIKNKIKVISLCLNGDMIPEWIKNNGNIDQGANRQKQQNIKKGDQILQEVLKRFLNLIIGCQNQEEMQRESWFDRIVEKNDSGGVLHIKVKNNKYLDRLKSMKEQINYQRECTGKSLVEVFCKLEGNFKNLWQDDVKKVIEEKIWKVLKEFMIGWVNLKEVKWGKKWGFINTVEWEIRSGKNKKKIQIEYGGGYTEFEIGEWWFKTGLIEKGKEEILEQLEKDKGSKKDDWVNKIKFMVGRNKANIEDFFKNWLWSELEKEFSEEFKTDCGIWSGGISCPEGGLVY